MIIEIAVVLYLILQLSNDVIKGIISRGDPAEGLAGRLPGLRLVYLEEKLVVVEVLVADSLDLLR